MNTGETPPVLPQLNCTINGQQLHFIWSTDYAGWRLEAQANSIGAGLGTNWVTVSGSSNINQMSIPINFNNGDVFFRLVYP